MVDEKIFCMHGGLSPEISSMDQIKRTVRPTDVPDTGEFDLDTVDVVSFRAVVRRVIQSSKSTRFLGKF